MNLPFGWWALNWTEFLPRQRRFLFYGQSLPHVRSGTRVLFVLSTKIIRGSSSRHSSAYERRHMARTHTAEAIFGPYRMQMEWRRVHYETTFIPRTRPFVSFCVRAFCREPITSLQLFHACNTCWRNASQGSRMDDHEEWILETPCPPSYDRPRMWLLKLQTSYGPDILRANECTVSRWHRKIYLYVHGLFVANILSV